MRVRPVSRHRLRVVLLILLISFHAARTSYAFEPRSPRRPSIAVAFLHATTAGLRIGDPRPDDLGTVGGTIRLNLPLSAEWSMVSSGRLSGTWSDFENGASNSGNVTVLEPGFRIGLARDLFVSPHLASSLGAAFEYSELRSWVHGRVGYLPYDVTGPRNFRRGSILVLTVETGRARAFGGFLSISEGVLVARASDPSLGGRYRWLSSSSSIEMGLSLHP